MRHVGELSALLLRGAMRTTASSKHPPYRPELGIAQGPCEQHVRLKVGRQQSARAANSYWLLVAHAQAGQCEYKRRPATAARCQQGCRSPTRLGTCRQGPKACGRKPQPLGPWRHAPTRESDANSALEFRETWE